MPINVEEINLAFLNELRKKFRFGMFINQFWGRVQIHELTLLRSRMESLNIPYRLRTRVIRARLPITIPSFTILA